MAEMQWLDKFGFYESADYTTTRIDPQQRYELIRCWMAHHQGMTLSAICNFLTDASLQQFFHSEPQVAANERILHERIPKSVVVDRVVEPKLPMETPDRGVAGLRVALTSNGSFSRIRFTDFLVLLRKRFHDHTAAEAVRWTRRHVALSSHTLSSWQRRPVEDIGRESHRCGNDSFASS